MNSNGSGPNGQVFVVSAARTPIGKFGGALSNTPAVELGGVAIAAAVERGLPPDATIDEVLMGQVLQAGVGQAPARKAALLAGLPETTSATTINRVCGSGLKSIMLAAAEIKAGDAEVVVAGGMESMNLAPYLLPKARFGLRLGNAQLLDGVIADGLWCTIEECHMGTHAERVAIKESVSREAQDRFALTSHERAIAAIDAGRFADEMAPVTITGPKGETVVDTDEGPRRDTSIEALAKLRPVFELPTGEDRGNATDGTVTAGNSPGITDGAAATIVASERAVEQWDLKPMARIIGYTQAEVAPKWLFLAPVTGVRKLLDKLDMQIADFDLVEINEAFAAQVIACRKACASDAFAREHLGRDRALGDLDPARTNPNGGAIALGHPIGASGARIVATLLHELRRRQGRYGLATLCLGGGGSVAAAFERV